jgi:hypothetical protein
MRSLNVSVETTFSLDNGMDISFTLDDDDSMSDKLVTVRREDHITGYLRMSDHFWPFHPELLYRGSMWMKVIDILYELGCWLEEEERRLAESQNG